MTSGKRIGIYPKDKFVKFVISTPGEWALNLQTTVRKKMLPFEKKNASSSKGTLIYSQYFPCFATNNIKLCHFTWEIPKARSPFFQKDHQSSSRRSAMFNRQGGHRRQVSLKTRCKIYGGKSDGVDIFSVKPEKEHLLETRQGQQKLWNNFRIRKNPTIQWEFPKILEIKIPQCIPLTPLL